jgi:hypothetical protein
MTGDLDRIYIDFSYIIHWIFTSHAFLRTALKFYLLKRAQDPSELIEQFMTHMMQEVFLINTSLYLQWSLNRFCCIGRSGLDAPKQGNCFCYRNRPKKATVQIKKPLPAYEPSSPGSLPAQTRITNQSTVSCCLLLWTPTGLDSQLHR